MKPKASTGAKLAEVKRTAYVRHPLDYYQEDRWASERLFDVERFRKAVLDPSCGRAAIVDSARAAGYLAIGSDVAEGEGRRPDFVHDWLAEDYPMPVADIVSNPPFMHCLDVGEINPVTKLRRYPFVWIRWALARAKKVALLLPADYLLGQARQAFLQESGVARVHYLSPRPWCGPAHIPEGMRSQGFTDLCWIIWERGHTGPFTGHFLNKKVRTDGK